MDAYRYITERQTLWARRHGTDLVPRDSGTGEPTYARNLRDNLFMELTTVANADFTEGDGSELGDGQNPGNMQAVYSSSAIAVNCFDYWVRLDAAKEIAAACELGRQSAAHIRYERKMQIFDNRKGPNLDVVFCHDDGYVDAIECKFREPYEKRPKRPLRESYFKANGLWDGLTNLQKLAEGIFPKDERFTYLHAAQLVTHVLGLTRHHGRHFRLAYLWYDVAGEPGHQHRTEIEEIGDVLNDDSIAFTAITWQELILALARKHRQEHSKYVDYLVERYL